jgi:hypothetical protein
MAAFSSWGSNSVFRVCIAFAFPSSAFAALISAFLLYFCSLLGCLLAVLDA